VLPDEETHQGHDTTEPMLQPLRFSLAGVQLKFSGLMDRQEGLTIPDKGMGGNWIIKLPSMTHDHVPENEYAMMYMAKEIGMNSPKRLF
jgi:serine/threonine-protein kinase HipA